MSRYDSSICDSPIPYRPRQLRKPKIVTYIENTDDEPSPNGTLVLNRPNKNKRSQDLSFEPEEDVDGDSLLSTSMDDDTSFSEASVHRKPVLGETLSRRTNLPKSDDSQESDDSSSSMCSLERRRLKNIQENKEFLKSLGITQMVEDLTNRLEEKKYIEKKKRVNRAKRRKVPLEPTRKSLRLEKRTLEESAPLPSPLDDGPQEELRKPSGPLHMEVVNLGANVQTECHYHLKKLVEQLICVGSEETTNWALDTRDQLKGPWDADEEEVTISGKPGDTFRSKGTATPNRMQDMNLDDLKTAMSQLTLDSKRVTRVLPTMIYSIALHPSETRLVVAAGGRAGQIALWDVLGETDLSVQVFQPHCGSVNCLSVCEYDQTKLYSTSHDGTVRRADLHKLIFDDIYSSDPDIFRNHTTWHCQLDNNVLLVAHGTGQVGVVDLRDSKKPTRWCKCHDRSVRTVQRHPLAEQYFVTSSAVGEARVWDLRTATKPSPKPVCHLAHPKGLTSAFYSSRGSYLLTTCNDDRLRVYDVRHVSTNRPPVIASTKHNNHTGRWLSTFKARWHPQREDTFIVGSMELPKAIEVYGIHGQKMIRLQSTANLTTICSACVFHPSQLLVAGANSSGKVHVFL